MIRLNYKPAQGGRATDITNNNIDICKLQQHWLDSFMSIQASVFYHQFWRVNCCSCMRSKQIGFWPPRISLLYFNCKWGEREIHQDDISIDLPHNLEWTTCIPETDVGCIAIAERCPIQSYRTVLKLCGPPWNELGIECIKMIPPARMPIGQICQNHAALSLSV